MIRSQAFRMSSPGYAGLETVVLGGLQSNQLLIKVHYSSVNYKDALSGTGTATIARKFPLTGGIDLAGVVVATTSPDFNEGDQVLATGSGLGETLDGGYAEHALVPAEIAIPIPPELSMRDTMIIGTAGFTAALGMERLLVNNQSPDLGPVVVTGASGGVGSFAVYLLTQHGFAVTAATRKATATDYLQQLGAKKVINRIEPDAKPLAKAIWGGAIDNLGGETLATLLKTTRVGGNVLSVGLAESSQLLTTVMPLIIRGVNLLGVSSANCSMALKKQVWRRLGTTFLPECRNQIVCDTIGLSDLPNYFKRVLAGQIQGRLLVKIS